MPSIGPASQASGLTNPVTLTTDANGVATAATFNTTQQKATGTGGGNGTAAAAAPGTTTGGPTSCRARTGTCSNGHV